MPAITRHPANIREDIRAARSLANDAIERRTDCQERFKQVSESFLGNPSASLYVRLSAAAVALQDATCDRDEKEARLRELKRELAEAEGTEG